MIALTFYGILENKTISNKYFKEKIRLTDADNYLNFQCYIENQAYGNIF